MRPPDLLNAAEKLLRAGNNRPAQVNLKRAQSTLYYALFHCLAKASADLFVGGTKNGNRSQPAWNQVYRALEHRKTKDRCRYNAMVKKFPPEIQAFADNFQALQVKRNKADYDPDFRLTKSEVCDDIELARQLIKDFATASRKHRVAFCAYVLFQLRTE